MNPHQRISLWPQYCFHSAIADPFLYQTLDADQQVRYITLKPVSQLALFFYDVVKRANTAKDYEFHTQDWFWRIKELIKYAEFILFDCGDAYAYQGYLILLDLTYFFLKLANSHLNLPSHVFCRSYPSSLEFHWVHLSKIILPPASSSPLQSDDSWRHFLDFMKIRIHYTSLVYTNTGESTIDLIKSGENNFTYSWIKLLIGCNWMDQAYLCEQWRVLAECPEEGVNWIYTWFCHISSNHLEMFVKLLRDTRWFSQFFYELQEECRENRRLTHEKWHTISKKQDSSVAKNIESVFDIDFRMSWFDIYSSVV